MMYVKYIYLYMGGGFKSNTFFHINYSDDHNKYPSYPLPAIG